MDLKNFFKKPNIIASISYLYWIGLIISVIINYKKKDKFISSHIKQALLLFFILSPITAVLFKITSIKIFVYIYFGLWFWFIVSAFLNKKAFIDFDNISFKMKRILFTIIGAILGLPLSFYFQPRLFGGITSYMKHFDEILKSEELIGNVVVGVIIFALVGFIIGYFMDKSNNPKIN